MRQIVPGPKVQSLGDDRFTADFDSPQSLAELHRLICGREGQLVGGIVNLIGVMDEFSHSEQPDAQRAAQPSTWLFNAFKELADDLCASAELGGGRVINVTRLDGKFGLQNCDPRGLASAGTLGVTKCLRREYPDVSVRNVDIAPDLPPELAVARLFEELQLTGDDAEIGISSGGRWRLVVREAEPNVAELTRLPVDENSVVLVTGGGDGITAEVTRVLAQARARLVIVGRTVLGEEESPETASLDANALRAHLLQQARTASRKLVPADIEREVSRILKRRRIRGYLREFESLGATVEYVSCDVRDEARFGGLIRELYDRYGRIDGVIHGSGVIQDKLIKDKSLESFRLVFSTKVDSALILARSLQPESLKFLVFFSSVSGRFGNVGQADYCAANEFLNKLARVLDRRWPARVVSINWGPWDAGMVTDTLRALYASRGIRPIPISEGVRRFETELCVNGAAAPEVVISCSVDRIAGHEFGRRKR